MAIVRLRSANWLSLAKNCGKYFGNQQLVSAQSHFLLQKKGQKTVIFPSIHIQRRFTGDSPCNGNCKIKPSLAPPLREEQAQL